MEVQKDTDVNSDAKQSCEGNCLDVVTPCVVQEESHIHEAEQPCLSRSTSAIHDDMCKHLQVLNLGHDQQAHLLHVVGTFIAFQ